MGYHMPRPVFKPNEAGHFEYLNAYTGNKSLKIIAFHGKACPELDSGEYLCDPANFL